MLISNQATKDDRPLRMLTAVVLCGVVILLVGLWYVQILSAQRLEQSLKNQTFRTVRIPAVRGKIFDRNGVLLAGNRPSFNVYVYLEDLRKFFTEKYFELKADYLREHPGKFPKHLVRPFEMLARYQVVSNLTTRTTAAVSEPLLLNYDKFANHYTNLRSLPLPILNNLNRTEVARFFENAAHLPGIELELQPLRVYPHGASAAHLLGRLQKLRDPDDGEVLYNYRLVDYRGVFGVERTFDDALRGRPGIKSMLVNNDGYRQKEDIWEMPEPGANLHLTIDLELQRAAEEALITSGADIVGAAIVMDVDSGDLLAVASVPSFDPNVFIPSLGTEEWEMLKDTERKPLVSRATFSMYHPGSIFKIVVGLACLEAGTLDPDKKLFNPGWYRFRNPRARPILDTAPEGEYDFVRAFKLSSNTYFIQNGLLAGPEEIVRMGELFGLGKRTGIPTHQEIPGIFPTMRDLTDGWYDGHTANLSIGQGDIDVTPLQMAVMTAAVANGGTVLKPRLVTRVEPQSPDSTTGAAKYPARQIVRQLPVAEKHFELIHRAMRADVADGPDTPDGQGSGHAAEIPGMEICGKTGTAEIKRRGQLVNKITWFASFSSLSRPRYAVVVMVDGGRSGGGTCAPIARRIYLALNERPDDSFSELTVSSADLRYP